MNWIAQSESPQKAHLVPYVGRESADCGVQKGSSKSIFEFFRGIWGLIKGHSADDIGRLKEAGIRQVEGKADLLQAEAAEKFANAAKARAEAEAIRNKSQIDLALSKIEVLERLHRTASRIRTEQGSIAIDAAELNKQIMEAGTKIQ